jgi:hypothetical protein
MAGCTPSKEKQGYEGDDVEILPPERLVKKLEANRRKIKTFLGQGDMYVKSPDFNSGAFFRAVLHKPDSINVTIYGPFKIELARILVTESDFQFYDSFANTLYMGPVSDDILRSIFQVDLDFNDFLDAFVGAVNLTDVLYKQPDTYAVENNQYILTYTDPASGSTKTYFVNTRDLAITYYSVTNAAGKLMLEGTYEDFMTIEEVAVPTEVTIENKEMQQKITLIYDKLNANDKSIFIDFEVPDDADVIEL